MRTFVYGLGLSGRAAARFLLKRDCPVRAFDSKWNQLQYSLEVQSLLSQGMEVNDSLEGINRFVLSPGIPLTDPLCLQAAKRGIPIIGEVELALSEVKVPVIGITGTNGKTTTTLLVEHILKGCGIKALALGNVGTPLCDGVDTPGLEMIVLELSSYQLETMNQQSLDAGAILNITPDHLDRYGTMANYAAAKCRIFRCLKLGAKCLIERETADSFSDIIDSQRVIRYSLGGESVPSELRTDGEQIFYQERIETILPKPYRGGKGHDVKNFLAAYYLCRLVGISSEKIVQASEGFAKPPHRLEWVKNLRGCDFVNDSKGTNVEAVISAVESFDRPILLLAGGRGKKAPYTSWIKPFTGKVRGVYAFGESKENIKADLASSGIGVECCESMEVALQKATCVATGGEVILLSPGCASFDQFRNYEHRGEEFKRLVNLLGDQK